MKKLFAMVKKEVRQIIQDKFYFRFLLAAPVLQMIILGSALTFDTKNVSTVICNLDQSKLSREIVEEISRNEAFEVVDYVREYPKLREYIQDWSAGIGIYIPSDFSKTLEREGTAEIHVLLDAVDGNQALTAYSYLQQIASEKSIAISPSGGGPGLTVEHHYLFNPELRTRAYMVPGIVVLIITIITLLIGAMSLVREKETGTLEQLSVTPIKRWQLILGKLLPFLVYAFIETAFVLKIAELIFGLSMAGSLMSLYTAMFIYLFASLGLGLFVSTIARTQQQALFIAWFFMIFLILLSGFLIPVQNMPRWLQYVTMINPLRYMMTAVREIYLKGTPVKFLADQLIPLAVLGGGIFGLSVARFRKKAG